MPFLKLDLLVLVLLLVFGGYLGQVIVLLEFEGMLADLALDVLELRHLNFGVPEFLFDDVVERR